MLHIDRLYADRIGPYVRNFQRRTTDLWNFSCPICGDSTTDARKARGYIIKRDNRLSYFCHNCGASLSLGNFLRHISPLLHQEYLSETFKENSNGSNRLNFSVDDTLPALASRRQHINFNPILDLCSSLSSLPADHFCKSYVRSRGIPDRWDNCLYYTERLGSIAQACSKDYKLKDGIGKLILPFFTEDGELFGVQARSLNPDEPARYRYITLMLDESQDKIFGLERLNPNEKFYIVEGPIDSLFLPNCLAMAGADAPDKYSSAAVNIFDNEPRAVDICKRMRKIINRGYQIVIWPRDIHHKDINDMVMAGLDVKHIIEQHTYKGALAQLKFNEWRRCTA